LRVGTQLYQCKIDTSFDLLLELKDLLVTNILSPISWHGC